MTPPRLTVPERTRPPRHGPPTSPIDKEDTVMSSPDDRAVLDDLERQIEGVIAAHVAAYHPGRDCQENAHGQCVDSFGEVPVPPYSKEQATKLNLPGWNIRCNRCGSYGAQWVPGQRPGWGDLALCPPHRQELAAECARHERALAGLRRVNYEQEI